MAYSQKYTIVQFLEPVQDSYEFTIHQWPLHITLADVFALELEDSVLNSLKDFLASVKCMSVTAGNVADFGQSDDKVAVTLLAPTQELQALHDGLIEVLQKHGAVFNSPGFTGQGFIPHSTHQKHAQLSVGQDVDINELSIVDMFVDHNWRQRKVLRTFKLDT